jgi:DNA polymerase-4
VKREVDRLARGVSAWLIKKGKTARTVTIKVRYSDFTTITRSQSTPEHTSEADEIARRALRLLDKTEAGQRPIRLLGVSVHNFGGTETGEAYESGARLPFE